MIINNKFRAALTFFSGALFVAAAFIFTAGTAQMQAGANTIVFDRYDAELNRSKIFVMNADGSNVVEIGTGSSPTWSANGARIAFTDGDGEQFDIWTMNADGSGKTRLTNTGAAYAAAWSPDCAKIAFVSGHEGASHVYLIDVGTGSQQRLPVTDAAVQEEYAPAWSADGSQIIFIGHRVVDGLSRHDYYAAQIDGAGTTQLTNLNAVLEYTPAAVAPDGSRIVFEYQHDLQAFLLNGGGQFVNLTNRVSGADEEPAYAPNGAKIVFRRGDYLAVMNADGSNVVNLDVVGSNPEWNPTAVFQTPTPTVTPTPVISADLSVTAAVSAGSVGVNQPVTYTINVANGGASAATNVTLGSVFPAALTLVSLESSQGACAPADGQIACQLGTLNANASATVTLVASPNQVGTVNSHFSAAAIEADPDAANNSAGVSLAVVGNCAERFGRPFEIHRSKWYHDDQLGRDVLVMTLRNISNETLDPRLMLVFDIKAPGVTLDPAAIDGYTQCAAPLDRPYIVAYAPNKREWKPMQTITVTIPFKNPSRTGIVYDWHLYTGSVNP